jgi:5-methylcytosine-specific restriction endonuclease McrBC regulatory subunit McrC
MLNRDIASVKFHRLNERFKQAYMLALLILGHRGLIAKEEPLPLVKDIHELFQKYICVILRRNLNCRVEQREYRISQNNSKNSIFPEKIIPDIIVEANGKIIPIDVKYKLLEKKEGEKVDPSDFYQVMFYAHYLNSPITFLVYPKWDQDGKTIIKECSEYKGVKICAIVYNFYEVLSKPGDLVRSFREYNKRFACEIRNCIEERIKKHSGSDC